MRMFSCDSSELALAIMMLWAHISILFNVYRRSMLMITDHLRLHLGLTSRGFVKQTDAGFYQHANGNSAVLGARTALTITDERCTRKASARDKYFIMQDGDLLFFNGIKSASRNGILGA